MTTKKDIRLELDRIKRRYGIDLGLDIAYGRPKIVTPNHGRNLSPRLPAGQLMTWLEGFCEALEVVENNKIERKQSI